GGGVVACGSGVAGERSTEGPRGTGAAGTVATEPVPRGRPIIQIPMPPTSRTAASAAIQTGARDGGAGSMVSPRGFSIGTRDVSGGRTPVTDSEPGAGGVSTTGIGFPHLLQNWLPSGSSARQFGQTMWTPQRAL